MKGIPTLGLKGKQLATTTKIKKQRPSPNTVEVLRKLGFMVRVYHGRVFQAHDYNDARIVTSKREMQAEDNNFHYTLLCHGGYTRVDITTPDGVELHGKYSFGNRQFNRKLGLQAAIGRAFTGRRNTKN